MAYKFNLDEPFDVGTRRIALEQINRARKQLSSNGDLHTAVHETRKCFKRVRALLRLVRPALIPAQYRKTNAHFRDLGRLLAQSRDLDVMPQTLAYLEGGHDLVTSGAGTRIRKAIANAQIAATEAASEPPIHTALKELTKARTAIRNLDLERCQLSSVAKGLARGMQSFASYYERALEEPSDEAFHEWRKRAQFHRRHVALLTAAWPDALEARVTVSRQLSDHLGLDHDLTVLAAFVSSRQGRPATKRDARLVLSLCCNEQHELRKKACAIGALLIAEPPQALRHRIEAYWTVRAEKAIDLKVAAE